MKFVPVFLTIQFMVSCATAEEKYFTASTPAASIIRAFLQIPATDSIDFIRWKLTLTNSHFTLDCNYGIGQNNTNGFINGGKHVSMNGIYKKEKNIYHLFHHGQILKLTELNNDLLHFLDADNSLLVGNAGWSYSLNNIHPIFSDHVNLIAKPGFLKDSMAFEGRTPCKVPGIVSLEMECYKLKWLITLYSSAKKQIPGIYKLYGTTYRNTKGRKGDWKIISGKNGRIIYQLNDEHEKGLIYLLKLDENILVFTDADGKLLTGDEDFSYTLNRKY